MGGGAWHHRRVLLCYVDESVQHHFHGFAGVMADEFATRSLTARLNKIMAQASVDFGIPATTELHAHPLFHGKQDWAQVPTRARVGVFIKTIDAVVSEDVTLLLRWVHEERLRVRQARENYRVNFPPEQVCFQHLLQRANKVAETQDTHALVIADNRADRERHRERFATYQTEGTPGVYMHTTLDRLLDTIHFAPSHQSRMLQAADMTAFVYRRFHTVRESDPRAAAIMGELYQAILEKSFGEGSWP